MALYWLIAGALLGTAAVVAALNAPHDAPNQDIWQHIATLRALIDGRGSPSNPFLATEDTSRHFSALWVAAAWLGGSLGLNPFTIFAAAGGVSMLVLAAGLYAFCVAYFRTAWGAILLLPLILFGWVIEVEHTGYLSFRTLLFAAAYPATIMAGMCFALWALVIQVLRQPGLTVALVPLVALMLATHQLGALIGLVVAGSLILLWPEGVFRTRLAASFACVVGIALSLLWPFYNPIGMMLRGSSSSWDGGPDFYRIDVIAALLLPAGLGFLGLRDRKARPFLLALGLFTGLYALGFLGLQVASRFFVPVTLILQIGLVSLLLELGKALHIGDALKRLTAVVFALALFGIAAHTVSAFQAAHIERRTSPVSPYAAAFALTQDLPNDVPIAAHGLSVWPVVATGQRVISIPWPEPGIPDLAERQSVTAGLFEAGVSWQTRLERASAAGVTTLIIDDRLIAAESLAEFIRNASSAQNIATYWRFDL
ncbi:MAG: hypothetical protein AAFQ36_10725 [Pseudomonadota bacterium]